MKNIGIRGRIALLIVISALPTLALIIHHGLNARTVAESRERENLQRIAVLATRQQREAIEGARQLLFALSGTADRLLQDAGACNEYFRSLLQASGGLYQSMGIHGADGYLACNAVPWSGRVDVNTRRYFRLAADNGKFAIGEYQVGKVTGRPGINLGHPALDAGGRLIGVVFAGIDLQRLDELTRGIPLPQEGAITILDSDGTILARYPDAGGRPGKKSTNQPLRDAMQAAESGLLEARDSRGVPRIYAFESVWKNPDGSIPIRVVVSIPTQRIFAYANSALAEALGELLAATLLLLLAAWYGTELLVMRKFRMLLDMAQRVSEGEFSVRTGLPLTKEEFSRLGYALDEMAQALENREIAAKQAMLELQARATTDPLTELYNRRYLQDFLKRELLRAARTGRPVAVIMLDLDHFKRVNDVWGHPIGDLVLKRVAGVIRNNVRGSDIACRYGGEEMMIVLPEATQAAAIQRAENIRGDIEQLAVTAGGKPIGVITASFGVAVYPEHGDSAEALIRAVDEALYEAKGSGRNRVMVSSRMPASRVQPPSKAGD